MASKTYKIRAFKNGRTKDKGKDFYNYSLTVPPDIAYFIPVGMRFECEATEDGILYRPVGVQEEKKQTPKWAEA